MGDRCNEEYSVVDKFLRTYNLAQSSRLNCKGGAEPGATDSSPQAEHGTNHRNNNSTRNGRNTSSTAQSNRAAQGRDYTAPRSSSVPRTSSRDSNHQHRDSSVPRTSISKFTDCDIQIRNNSDLRTSQDGCLPKSGSHTPTRDVEGNTSICDGDSVTSSDMYHVSECRRKTAIRQNRDYATVHVGGQDYGVRVVGQDYGVRGQDYGGVYTGRPLERTSSLEKIPEEWGSLRRQHSQGIPPKPRSPARSKGQNF